MNGEEQKDFCLFMLHGIDVSQDEASELSRECDEREVKYRILELQRHLHHAREAAQEIYLDLALIHDAAWDGMDPDTSSDYQKAKSDVNAKKAVKKPTPSIPKGCIELTAAATPHFQAHPILLKAADIQGVFPVERCTNPNVKTYVTTGPEEEHYHGVTEDYDTVKRLMAEALK